MLVPALSRLVAERDLRKIPNILPMLEDAKLVRSLILLFKIRTKIVVAVSTGKRRASFRGAMSSAASRALVEGSASEVLRLARFLRKLPDTTREFDDLYQWTKHAEALSIFLPTCSASCLQDLVCSSDLHELLCSSLAHALQLLVAAANAQPALDKQDMQCVMVLISLLVNINVLSNSCKAPTNGGLSHYYQRMKATMELTSECSRKIRGRHV
jgi:hypothetical protein